MTRAAAIPIGERCVLCRIQLEDADQIRAGLCDSCAERPEAKRVGPRPSVKAATPTARPAPQMATPTAPLPAAAAVFTPAEKALIRNLHGLLPGIDLLRLLNHRRFADLGPDAPRHTLEQLFVETRQYAHEATAAGDWSQLRRILADARKSGVLAAITPQVLDDFAAVYSLAPAQLMALRDVMRWAKERS